MLILSSYQCSIVYMTFAPQILADKHEAIHTAFRVN